MTTMIIFISYFYVKNTNKEFEMGLKKFVSDSYLEQKSLLKKEIDVLIDVIKYKATNSSEDELSLKKDIIKMLNNITYEQKRSNYVFVYEINNMKGGKKFAKLLVNPNRIDLVGTHISTNFKDNDGKKFREEFLKDIREKGESYTQYAYKKISNDKIYQKLSYFKYYPAWNWVIAVGVYIDDIEEDIAIKKAELKQKVKNQIVQNILLFVLFLSIGIVITILVSEKIDEFFKEYREKVKLKSAALIELNATLERKVQEEIDKNREKEQLLVHKSRLIALGEMISNISHQWRQPLSELSSILMNIKFKYKMKLLDEEEMNKKSKEAEIVLDYMSHTIDDFRNFYMPKKDKQEFELYRCIEAVMTIISSTLANNNIKVEIDILDKIKLNTYLNELEQVVLNIISNAKDVLITKEIKNPLIKISAIEEGKNIILYIEDNAGGVTAEPKGRIFEPYFTTKEHGDGTGIGLYMSKIIVNKNIKGILKVSNTNIGAKFEIVIPKTN